MEAEIDRIARNLEDDIIHLEDAKKLLEWYRLLAHKNRLVKDLAGLTYKTMTMTRGMGHPERHVLIEFLAATLDRPLSRKKHAPACPANHYCKTIVPRGPCSCGGEALQEFSYCTCWAILTTPEERTRGTCGVCATK